MISFRPKKYLQICWGGGWGEIYLLLQTRNLIERIDPKSKAELMEGLHDLPEWRKKHFGTLWFLSRLSNDKNSKTLSFKIQNFKFNSIKLVPSSKVYNYTSGKFLTFLHKTQCKPIFQPPANTCLVASVCKCRCTTFWACHFREFLTDCR